MCPPCPRPWCQALLHLSCLGAWDSAWPLAGDMYLLTDPELHSKSLAQPGVQFTLTNLDSSTSPFPKAKLESLREDPLHFKGFFQTPPLHLSTPNTIHCLELGCSESLIGVGYDKKALAHGNRWFKKKKVKGQGKTNP